MLSPWALQHFYQEFGWKSGRLAYHTCERFKTRMGTLFVVWMNQESERPWKIEIVSQFDMIFKIFF